MQSLEASTAADSCGSCGHKQHDGGTWCTMSAEMPAGECVHHSAGNTAALLRAAGVNLADFAQGKAVGLFSVAAGSGCGGCGGGCSGGGDGQCTGGCACAGECSGCESNARADEGAVAARQPLAHDLHVDRDTFQAIASGAQCATVSPNDRDYQVGDLLNLLETAPTRTEQGGEGAVEFTGWTTVKRVSHVQVGHGLPEHLVLLSVGQESSAPQNAAEAASWTGIPDADARREEPARSPGSDQHLALLIAQHGLTTHAPAQTQRLLAFGREVWEAALTCAASDPLAAAPAPCRACEHREVCQVPCSRLKAHREGGDGSTRSTTSTAASARAAGTAVEFP